MLRKLPDHISACLERAAHAERLASDATDAALKQDYAEIAQSWRTLAASYEFSERLEQFIDDVDAYKRSPAA